MSEKKRRDRLIRLAAGRGDWALGCANETWWSRFPNSRSRTICHGVTIEHLR